jgi:hypothetical protein
VQDHGLDLLLSFDGERYVFDGGFWVKYEVERVEPDENRPHGIKYSLTLHAPDGTRILGYDNAHRVRPAGKHKYSGRRLPYDHRHRAAGDEGVPDEFVDAATLMGDFLAEVEAVIKRYRDESD